MPQVFSSVAEEEKSTFSVLFAKTFFTSSASKRYKSMAGAVSVVNSFPDPTRAPREEFTDQ